MSVFTNCNGYIIMAKKNKNSLWVEKYRPEGLDGYICSQEIKDKFQNFIDNNDIPHLLFAGNVGIGKTTAARLLINNLVCDYIVINASDDRGIDVVRTKIMNFAQSSGFNDLKIVLLEEADKLTPDAQEALRYITEQFSASTRFIFTCNYIEMLSDPLKSRFTSMSLVPPSMGDVAKHLLKILEKENVEYNKKDVAELVKENYPDIRHMIKTLQNDSHTGKYVPSGTQKTGQKYIEDIIDILTKKKSPKEDFQRIRQAVADSGAFNFIPLYKQLYKNVDTFAGTKRANVMLIIAEMMYKDKDMADKEINAMSCLIQIINEIYG